MRPDHRADRSLTPTTEADLRAVTVGELKDHNAPVVLVDYDPHWPSVFDAQARSVAQALGKRALAIEHVGSTSVPQLCAKPIIDMLLVVGDSSDEAAYVPDLEAAGYVLEIREPQWYEHRKFKGPGPNVNLHVFSAGCPEIARMLAFRDRLRSDDGARERYASAKRDLAKRTWKYVQNYADAKTQVIEAILACEP